MEQIVSELFSQYAYSPWLVYGAICFFMLLSAFGLPIPEEVVLVSSGFVGYMSLHPNRFPPPYEGAPKVNVYILAGVAFCAVMASDFLIYWLGTRFGPKLFKTRWFSRLVNEAALERIQRWMWNYGYWTVLIFRFTPGVRFPGHLTCGAMGLSRWRFLAVDWLAAGISVPTQVLLVAFYGKFILTYFTQFKIYFFGTIGTGILIFVIVKYIQSKRAGPEPLPAAVGPRTAASDSAASPTHPPAESAKESI